MASEGFGKRASPEPYFGPRVSPRAAGQESGRGAVDNHIDLQGASGTVYRYRYAGEAEPKTAMSGNFAYVAADRRVIFLGQTDNLMTGARTRWNEASSKHGATQLFIRLNISAAARNSELLDLLGAISTPMNPEARGSRSAASAAASPAPAAKAPDSAS